MRDTVDSFKPQKESKSCISWGHRQKCSTGTVEVTVENSYPILGGNKGHSLVVDDVNASCFVGVTSLILLIEVIGQTC